MQFMYPFQIDNENSVEVLKYSLCFRDFAVVSGIEIMGDSFGTLSYR